MPYFVYRVSMDRQNLSHIDTHEKFKAAKDRCRELRKAQKPGDTEAVRLIFAKDQREAEALLSTKHKASSPTEEWET